MDPKLLARFDKIISDPDPGDSAFELNDTLIIKVTGSGSGIS